MHNPLWSCFIIILLLTGCGWNGTPTRNNEFTPLSSMEITAVTPAIAAHTSTKLSVKGNYSGLFTRDITDQVTWSSATPAVAGFVTAAVPNRVTGQAPGTANLTATLGTVSATFNLTVSTATATSLTLTPAAPSLARGLTSQFALTGTFSDATTQDLTFDAGWLSSAPTVATIGNDPVTKGLVRALAVGNATITATFDGANSSTLLTVTPAALRAITVTPADPVILSLSTTGFTAVGTYSDGSTADITGQAVWNSSRPDIATIATSGTAKTLKPGTTTISATMGGVSGISSVKVTGGVLTGISLSPTNPRLVKGTTGRITATGSFSTGCSRDISGAVDWSLAIAGIATVTTPGGNQAWLNPLTVTTGTIVTATSGTVSTDAVLTVTAPQLRSLAITPAAPDLTAKTSDRLTATAGFSDGTSQDVTASSAWTTNDATVASIANAAPVDKGRVTGVAVGPATITAAYGGLTTTTTVTVRNHILQDLTISGSSTAAAGNQVVFAATASYSDGFTKNVTADTAWSIDKTSTATLADPLSQPGQVVMVTGGLATLTAKFGGLTRTVLLSSQVP